MNRNIIHTIWMAALPLLLASCQQEELPGMNGASDTTPLSITVTDGGYVSTGKAVTRAVENGYRTEFTAGDEVGLYIVRDGALVYDNVKLTATAGADGSLTWQPEAGTELCGGLDDEAYYLCYPYQANMSGKVDIAATDAEGFFAPLVSGWQPKADQSTYAAYSASDLMTAKGAATKGTDGMLSLSFSMTHRMALAVIEMPKTVYKFTNTDVTIPDYIVASSANFTDGSVQPYGIAPGTYRCIVNPASSTATSITGSYDDGKKEFTVTPNGIAASSYKTYKVDGAQTVEKSHNLQLGDCLMVDGTLVSKDVILSVEEKANVAAIVFWSPAETDPAGRTTPANLMDDKIMAADFPDCNHGLAVAVKKVIYKDSEYMAWQDSYEFVNDFQSSNNFTHKNKSQFASIASGTGNTANSNRILGYQNTQVLLAYNNYCTKSGKESYIVKPAATIAEFALANHAPAGSTGWYLPSPKELHMLCYKDVDNVWMANGFAKTDTRDFVNVSLAVAGGDALEYDSYWSSSEHEVHSDCTFRVNFYSAIVGYGDKEDSDGRVRAVCAF